MDRHIYISVYQAMSDIDNLGFYSEDEPMNTISFEDWVVFDKVLEDDTDNLVSILQSNSEAEHQDSLQEVLGHFSSNAPNIQEAPELILDVVGECMLHEQVQKCNKTIWTNAGVPERLNFFKWFPDSMHNSFLASISNILGWSGVSSQSRHLTSTSRKGLFHFLLKGWLLLWCLLPWIS